MAVRVADSLKQQNDLKSFPVAYAEDLWLDKNKGSGEKDYSDLQTLFDNGELGGGGSIEWTGTKAEWEALSTEEKAKYDGKKLNFTDSEGESLIDDTAPANNKVYSSSKVESLLTGIGTIYRANWTKTEASEVNEDLTEELTLGKGNYILIAQIPFVNAVDGARLYSIYNKTDFIYESFAMSQYSYASFLAVISIDSTKTYAIKDSGGAVSTGYDARYIDRGYLKAIKLDA